ncbi:hypothetical protein m4_igs_878 [Acanthamoeba polyphaga mimivirus]|nr:hypothetical protein m4_igs_2 [Acanthamoeba polyphaga mimivirus]UTE96766.1 hypothetical protein m4_igs_878 [Acanthamoeba polyphaga mimivirus]
MGTLWPGFKVTTNSDNLSGTVNKHYLVQFFDFIP